ncbi:hypothetical protein ACERII_05705 [Evansella sp. AB-rgal1]|uniref:hypothetical protein n=1 Tax=Evansella sp. AB-rgal1 TaxID=3242696 RepID=UPI00359CC892
MNKETGKIVSASVELLGLVEDGEIEEGDSHPNFEQEMMEDAFDIVDNFENYIELPSGFDIDSYSIMEDFCNEVKPENGSDRLCRAIRGRGAFRRFKDLIIELGVAENGTAMKESDGRK